MNLIKAFRKPYFALLFASIILFTSCNINDDNTNSSIDSFDLETMHSKLLGDKISILNREGGSVEDYFTQEELDSYWREFMEPFPEALRYAQENGAERLLIEYGYNPEIITISESLRDVFQTERFYEELAKYKLNEKDSQDVIIYLEFDKHLEDLYFSEGVARASSGCGRAIVSSLLVTAGAAVATIAAGPTGVGALTLGFWCVTKAWATYNLIQSCRD